MRPCFPPSPSERATARGQVRSRSESRYDDPAPDDWPVPHQVARVVGAAPPTSRSSPAASLSCRAAAAGDSDALAPAAFSVPRRTSSLRRVSIADARAATRSHEMPRSSIMG
jgi:hypothetical protein